MSVHVTVSYCWTYYGRWVYTLQYLTDEPITVDECTRYSTLLMNYYGRWVYTLQYLTDEPITVDECTRYSTLLMNLLR